MTIETFLNDPVNSYLIYHPKSRTDVLIAAPHHAPLWVSSLPCETHPTADENSGWIAYHLAKKLDCACLIAGNYFLDVNKHMTSDYFKKIEAIAPKILIEIHGHGSGSAKFNIEISSGSEQKSTQSQLFANQLSRSFASHHQLRDYTISGDFNQIHYKATRSLTINTNQWTAFHIELPYSLRKDEKKYLLFCEFVKTIVVEMLRY